MRELTELVITKFKLALGMCRYIGHDSYGNHYFETTKKVRKRRWILYQGKAEGSKVPPLWHAWLNHTVKAVPIEHTDAGWQKRHLPNLSGTKYAYKPTLKPKIQKTYQAWIPKG